MKLATLANQNIDALYEAAKERYRALTIERANRIVENWEIAHFPDERDRELVGMIHEARREFLKLQAIYLSARGEYVFIGCYAGEHKKCNRQVRRDGATLVCGCECHQLQGGVK
jgi:hypothetical protein